MAFYKLFYIRHKRTDYERLMGDFRIDMMRIIDPNRFAKIRSESIKRLNSIFGVAAAINGGLYEE